MPEINFPLEANGTLGAKVISGSEVAYTDSLEQFIDDFENGDLSNYSGDTANFAVQTNNVYEGTYSLEATSDGAGYTIYSMSGLNYYPQAGDTFQFQMYTTDTDNAGTGGNSLRIGFRWCVQSSSEASFYAAMIKPADDDIQLRVSNSGNLTTLASATYEGSNYSGEWLRPWVSHATDGTISYDLYDSTDALIASCNATDTSFTSGGAGWKVSAAGNATGYLDAAKVI